MPSLEIKFCSFCGTEISQGFKFCHACGAEVPGAIRPTNLSSVKSKSVAVVLAVFFGLWSWLYTFKVDSKKFWAASFTQIVSLAALLAIYSSALAEEERIQKIREDTAGYASTLYGYDQCMASGKIFGYVPDCSEYASGSPSSSVNLLTGIPTGIQGFLAVYVILQLSIWIWAIFSQASKRDSFFQNYNIE